ncbi:hypothetical protein CryarDRAFT_0232 [Cryptosporangium arvum DSM 44712]|uniref:Uncharacterized protein n=1 Tax=Cryptosporangium arvum DSM 44712 TaxID=927661 RepID=A0A010ZKM8_9ACTN|nr:hypothetical protein CryarDRAFT_0232 [Cryptosporangium arvum DSM 44712]
MTARNSWVSPHHHGSHRDLLRPVRVSAPSNAHVDMIAVPTSRPVSYLAHAVRLAERLDCTLLVLASGKCSASEVVRRYGARLDDRLIVIDVPIGYAQSEPMFRFRADAVAPEVTTRPSDTSVKRNLALVLAKSLGVRALFFLDDDIIVPDWVDVCRAAAVMGRGHRAAGLFVDGYPDNSVVCHANRLTGGQQDTFVGGGALMVDAQQATGFFPNVYNEDWFFLLDSAADRAVATTGTAVQRPYDPFHSPHRARGEEFGDVLAEGLFWRLDLGDSVRGADAAFWKRALDRRLHFIDEVQERVGRMRDAPSLRWRIEASLEAATLAHHTFTPSICAHYLESWLHDRKGWNRRLARMPFGRPLGELLASLHLTLAGTADPGMRTIPAPTVVMSPDPQPLADSHGEPLWGLRSPLTVAAAGRRASVPSVDSSLTA